MNTGANGNVSFSSFSKPFLHLQSDPLEPLHLPCFNGMKHPVNQHNCATAWDDRQTKILPWPCSSPSSTWLTSAGIASPPPLQTPSCGKQKHPCQCQRWWIRGAVVDFAAPQPSCRQQFVSLGDYVAVDSTELCLREGDLVEVLRVGSHGWWYARLLTTGAEGWVPSTFLEPVPPQQQSANSSSGKNTGTVCGTISVAYQSVLCAVTVKVV